MLVEQGHVPPSWRARVFFLRQALPYPRRLSLLFTFLKAYQRTGLQRLFRNTVYRLLPALRDADAMLPHISDVKFDDRSSTSIQSGPAVALLSGCVMPYIYPGTHAATVRVLARNRVRAMVPQAQRCCGALNLHAGDRETARTLARINVDAFPEEVAAVVVNSAGCGSTMKEYGELLADDPRYAERARRFADRVKDISEYLQNLPLEPPRGRLTSRVTYQDSCHLVHAQRVMSAPREILLSIPGLKLIEMEAPDRCCGSAGIYSFAQREMSLRLLDEKVRDILNTHAGIVATANPGCMMQLELGLKRSGGAARVLHVIEVLDQAYAAEQQTHA
jgi:glycolate oxidase iron-sulfur subunit